MRRRPAQYPDTSLNLCLEGYLKRLTMRPGTISALRQGKRIGHYVRALSRVSRPSRFSDCVLFEFVHTLQELLTALERTVE